MGSRIAGRLLDAGHHVYGTNRTGAKAQPLIERGLIWRDTPREVAGRRRHRDQHGHRRRRADAITAGPDGLLAGLSARNVYVDMSTVSPRASRELADAGRERAARRCSTRRCSGSVPQAETGTLAIMVGGDERRLRGGRAAAARTRPDGDPRRRQRPGPRAQARDQHQPRRADARLQRRAAARRARRHRPRARGRGDEREPDRLADAQGARSRCCSICPTQAWFDIELMHKDIRLAREAAAELAIALPSAAVADEILTNARQLGYAHRDIAALHQVLARMSAGTDQLATAATR